MKKNNMTFKQGKCWLLSISLLLGIIQLGNAQRPEIKKPFHHPDYTKTFAKNLLAPIMEPGKVFYVSTKGKDTNKGTKKKPFKTIEKARDAIRTLKTKKGLPKGGVHVIVLQGVYAIDKTFKLTKEDSGTKEAPIVYKGVEGGSAVLSGGVKLNTKNLKPVKDQKLLERLHEKAKGNVMSIDLSSQALDAYFPGEGKYGQISMNGHMLQIAQWPNKGYNHIGKFVETGPTTRWLKPGEKPMPYSKENPTGGKFILKEALSPLVQKEFERTGDMRAQGYFHNDWYFQDEPLGAFNKDVVQLLHHTRYGILNKIKSIPRRVRLVNVLAELDLPGEWYFDKKEQRLYVWPIKGFVPGKSSLTVIGDSNISANDSFKQPGKRKQLTTSLISLEGTSYVTIQNFIIENSAALAVNVKEGQYNLIAACTLRNGAGKGVAINGGKYNGITGCDFYDLYSAFTINGGDFKTLEWSHLFATNNDIKNCRLRGYGVISLNGVGLYFAHNVLHDMNGAVMYRTVEMLMEYNEFYNIGYEMGDFNVAYCGAQWYMMNNVLRYNFVHHIMEPGGHPITGFRNDDNGAGMKVYGNVFYRSGRGSCIFHGFLNDFENNISMDAPIMWWTLKKPITLEGIKEKWEGLAKFGRDLPKGDKGDYIYIMEQIIGKDGWKKGVWKEKYPELEWAINKNPWAQTGCTVDKNYIYKIPQPFHIHGGDGTVEGLELDYEGKFDDLPHDEIFKFPKPITLDAFKDVSKLDFSFKPEFKPMEGFEIIPFEKIGFVKDRFRTDPLDKEKYRAETYQHFLKDKGGRYNATVVNSRYPTPAYLKEKSQ